MTTNERKFKVGDWIEVRTKEEILKTLDAAGRLDGMPFMPEMFEFCGRKLQVYKRAHKTCAPDLRSRRIENTVHLQTRCNGHAHGGCQAGCVIFWKTAWLKPAHTRTRLSEAHEEIHPRLVNIAVGQGCSESVVRDRVRVPDKDGDGFAYFCQTTRIQYEKPLPWWDIRQYLEDYSSGNVSLPRLFRDTIYSMYYNLSQSGLGLGTPMRRIYERLRPLWGGLAWPRSQGLIPLGQPTPTATLNLQPGEWVRVKSLEEILRTVDTNSKNRGLWWDAELVPYCGGVYKVLARVTNIIDETTGKMQVMKTPSIILDSVTCQARFSACRMLCPRATYAYWREIWLERTTFEISSVGNSQISAGHSAGDCV